MSHWLLFAKKIVGHPKPVGSSTCSFYFEICMGKIKNTSNFRINGGRSTELTESFLLVYRYLDFDNG